MSISLLIEEGRQEGAGRKLQKLSVSQVSDMVGKSARHIRNMCKEGKLPCQKLKISTGEKYLIYVDSEEFQELLNSRNPAFIEEENTPLEGEVSGSEEGSYLEEASSWQEIIVSMTAKIESLAKEAGKAELLVDTLMTTENDVKYYQSEYFKIQQELTKSTFQLEEVKKDNDSLRKKVEELQKELENRSKPFWARR